MTPKPRTMRAEQAERTRAGILAAALRLFNERGYDATSLQDIADELGLTKQAVYYHYRGKAEMLRDLAEPAGLALAELMERIRAADNAAERIDTTITGLSDILLARRDVLRVVARQPDLRHDMHAAVTANRICEVLLEGLFAGRPTLDQRFAVASAALAVGVQALGEVPEDQIRAVLERALRRIAEIR